MIKENRKRNAIERLEAAEAEYLQANGWIPVPPHSRRGSDDFWLHTESSTRLTRTAALGRLKRKDELL
jgi:hypothetical protein